MFHKIADWLRLEAIWSNPLLRAVNKQVAQSCYIQLRFENLNISKEGDSTISLGNLSQCLVTLTKKKGKKSFPDSVLVHVTVPPQRQRSAFYFAKFLEAPIRTLPQLVEVPLSSSTTSHYVNHSPQFCTINKFVTLRCGYPLPEVTPVLLVNHLEAPRAPLSAWTLFMYLVIFCQEGMSFFL